MRRSLVACLLTVGCLLVWAGAALAAEPGFTPPDPASPNAERINDSYLWIAIFTGAIFVVVQGALIWFIVRYRADKRRRDEDGAQIHGNTNLEIAWTVVPVLIVAAIGSFIFYKLPGIADVPSAQAEGGRTEVLVKGYRFYWNYEYENGVIAVDRMRAPVGRNTRLEITSQEGDVIHSWWIPRLGGKFDAIPGNVNETWFNANAPGIYRGQCAEFCGIQHAAMTAEVEAMPAEEFDDWLEEEAQAQEAGTSRLGEETYIGACAKCHGEDGHGGIGPRLAGNPTVQEDELLERIVRNGREQMPPIGPDWGDRQMDALVTYIQEDLSGGG